ncbi:MAG TPA: hypothetical protein VJ453_06235, partial [Terriglobales bacterium]|nr:hypothetical protein [Terriglobales bacterium]
NIYDDDVVAITIDAFRDHPHELNFANNPLGVQADGLWTEGSNNNPDNSWDTGFIYTDRVCWTYSLSLKPAAKRWPIADFGFPVIH